MTTNLSEIAFLPVTHAVFSEKVPQNVSIKTPFRPGFFKAVSADSNKVAIEISDDGFIALRGGSGTGLCFINFTTIPLASDEKPPCEFSIRVNAINSSVNFNANFNAFIECENAVRVNETCEVVLKGASDLNADILTDEQSYASLSNKRTNAKGECVYTLNAKNTGFVCIRCWDNAGSAEHAFKIVQILPPRHKKSHTPFFNYLPYQLASGESRAINVSNAPNIIIQSLDESIVKLTNNENGFLNDRTAAVGVSEGQTALKIIIPETTTCKETIFTLPIACKNNDGTGSFNFGNSAGGTTKMNPSPPQTNKIYSDEYYTINARSTNPTNNEYPRFKNLTPQFLNVEVLSEENKSAQVRVRAKGNGLGLLALFCADKEMNAKNGIYTGGYRLVTRWQVASFECKKYPRKIYKKVANEKRFSVNSQLKIKEIE